MTCTDVRPDTIYVFFVDDADLGVYGSRFLAL